MRDVYLLGPDSDVWDNPDHLDLLCIDAKKRDNALSRLITTIIIDWFHRTIGWRLRVRI